MLSYSSTQIRLVLLKNALFGEMWNTCLSTGLYIERNYVLGNGNISNKRINMNEW
jgi:hypothetical protein